MNRGDTDRGRRKQLWYRIEETTLGIIRNYNTAEPGDSPRYETQDDGKPSQPSGLEKKV